MVDTSNASVGLPPAAWAVSSTIASPPKNKPPPLDLFAYVSRHLRTTAAGVPYNPFRDPAHFVRQDTLQAALERLGSQVQEWLRVHDAPSTEAPWMGTMEFIYRQGTNLTLRPEPVDPVYRSLERVRWIGWALATAVLLTSLGFLAWVYYNKMTRLVRASLPLFLYMICTGCFIMASALFPLGIDDTITSVEGASIACMAAPWLFACGFVMSFSALFSKQWRINKIFHNPRFQRIKVTERDVITPFIAMFSIISTWSFCCSGHFSTPCNGGGGHVQVDELNSYGRCAPRSSDGFIASVFVALLAGINLISLVAANIQAYKARLICDEFSESQYIALDMFASLEVVIFTLPVFFLVKDSPSANYFVLAAIDFVICMSLLLLFIFGPKTRLLGQPMFDSRGSSNDLGSSNKTHGTSQSGGTFRPFSRSSRGAKQCWRHQSTGELGIKITTVSALTTVDDNTELNKEKLEDYERKLGELRSLMEDRGIDAKRYLEDVGIDLDAEDRSESRLFDGQKQESTVRFNLPDKEVSSSFMSNRTVWRPRSNTSDFLDANR